MYDTDELRAQISMARFNGDMDEVRRLQNIMCGIFDSCEACGACLGWRKAGTVKWNQN